MKFEKVNEKNLRTISPNNSTMILSTMSNEKKEEYIELYNMYRRLFSEFIIKKIDLQEYDKKIESSELKFKQLAQEDMDIYQFFTSDELRYFYIRNNIYIENLTDEEKNILKRKMLEENYELDEEALKMIESTYKKVIFEDALKNGKKCFTFFGPNSRNFMAENDSLVIGVRYDEFFSEGMNDEEWDKLHDNQLIYLSKIVKEMDTEMKNKIDIPVSILMYDDFSTKRRQEDIQKKEEEER